MRYGTLYFICSSYRQLAEHVVNFRVKKGDRVIVPILALNIFKGIWGEDASEFKCAFIPLLISDYSLFEQAGEMDKPPRSCNADSWCLGTHIDVPSWSKGLHRLPVCSH